MTENDKFLLEGLANNDKTAIEAIYKTNYTSIQSLVLNNNGDIDDAKDIFQEGIIVLYEKAISGNFDLNCALKTYLYSVCRHLWLKKLQHKQRYTEQIHFLGEIIQVDEEIELHEKKNADFTLMEKAMVKIGEPCKSLLEAYYVQKKSMQEIAATFGYTNADNAKTQKYKCLIRLKKLFFAQYKTL
ncbi:MAG: sigma-70 family RNA polymerase sigma factor [Chitinophagaceae bacterium]|nr:sigma-70 family RNA polymerase sigma factor [Chitinophagaceae bacterium]